MSTIVEEMESIRSAAHVGGIGKRKSSVALYNVLARCLAVVERCHNRPDELQQLRELPSVSKKRRYLFKDSDTPLIVARYAFEDSSNAWRYASCLREAIRYGITSDKLAAYLRDNGGVNALFLERPGTRNGVATRILYLSQLIEVDKHRPITLTLQRRGDGRFDVLKVEKLTAEASREFAGTSPTINP